VGILKIHKVGLFLVLRVAFILANIATYFEEFREFIYFDLNGFPEIYNCLDYYLSKGEKDSAKDIDKIMRMSFTKIDSASAKENDQDAQIKLIRLLANLFTLDKIGIDFITKHTPKYKAILQKLNNLISEKKIKANEELIQCTLSCFVNMMFYEKPALIAEDFEMKKLKTEILFTLSKLIIQNESQEICLEALRVLSNLSRNKGLVKQILKLNLYEAVVTLLNHGNKDIVYFCIGIIMNLMLNEEVKASDLKKAVLKNLTQILFDSTMEDYEIISCALKCLANILDNIKSEDVERDQIKSIEELVVNYGDQCDILLSTSNKGNNEQSESRDIADLRSIVNQLLNIIPEENFSCPLHTCGRKFKSAQELQLHVSRRHKMQ
jgi:hypothetical protein